MERWSYETHRDDTWIYGKTYVDGEFTTCWMQLIEKLDYAPRWMYDKASRKPVQRSFK